jgi:thiamine pyrophosphokinase
MSIWVFTGGLYPPPEAVRHILEAAGPPDFVIAADSGLYAAEAYQAAYGFAVNVVTGDMDSLESAGALSRYPPESIDRQSRDKDLTDTELALVKAQAVRTGGPVVLIGGDGGRVDHLLGVVSLFNSPLAPDIWLCAAQAVYALGGSHPRALEVRGLTADDAVSVFPALGLAPVPRLPGGQGGGHKIRAQGLFWDITGLPWDEGAYSLSNRAAPGHEAVRLEADSGVFFAALPQTCRVSAEPPW